MLRHFVGAGVNNAEHLLVVLNTPPEFCLDAFKAERVAIGLTVIGNTVEVLGLFFLVADRAVKCIWQGVVHGSQNVIMLFLNPLEKGPEINSMLHYYLYFQIE